MDTIPLNSFAPPFEPVAYSREEKYCIKPFFTNLDRSVYAPLIFSPEVIGALCSRASRAPGDLRPIFLNEYVLPFLKGTEHGEHLKHFIDFLHNHSVEDIFSNPRARSFYARWLAQYGDDSIAQMAGMHIVFSGLSQIAIKHLEDQRIGLAPIEKSTRYVDYSQKINGQYQYYTDPTLKNMGFEREYRSAMDGLFDTYVQLLSPLQTWLTNQFPDEESSVIEKKAFDTLRGLLPMSTLSQVAFFGNGQAFEYAVNRCAKHQIGEIRWAGEQMYQELSVIAPSFLRRIKDTGTQDVVGDYQEYLAGKGERVAQYVDTHISQPQHTGPAVVLVEHDPEGESKVIAGIMYSAPNNYASWGSALEAAQRMNTEEKRRVIATYLKGRSERWQKVGRAFENTYVRFEVVMNIGAWRDLHRHRMLTQQRQYFTTQHGYDVPPEVTDAGIEQQYRAAIERVNTVHEHIAAHDVHIAQYATTLAHRMRFMQWENVRECFWEMELRTIPEGHPDYRHIEQEKFRLLSNIYPLFAEHMRVNLGEYDFARRGQEEKIQEKLQELKNIGY